MYNLLLRGWFKLSGRSSRKEYILKFIMMWLLVGVFLFVGGFFRITSMSNNELLILLSVATLCICFILLIFSVLQMFLVTHRRLHDLNASGWWQIVTFIPFGQILMIGFIFFKGTDGRNEYGDPPEY